MTDARVEGVTRHPVSWTSYVWHFLNFVWCSIYRHEYRRVEGAGDGPNETHWHCRRCYDYRVGPYLRGECTVSETVHADELMMEDLNDV